jgi:hypothetical protein
VAEGLVAEGQSAIDWPLQRFNPLTLQPFNRVQHFVRRTALNQTSTFEHKNFVAQGDRNSRRENQERAKRGGLDREKYDHPGFAGHPDTLVPDDETNFSKTSRAAGQAR